jgi:hypothetical protein
MKVVETVLVEHTGDIWQENYRRKKTRKIGIG